jgi:hypothetical protein
MAAAAAWEAARGRLPPELGEALEHSGEPDLAGLRLLAAFPEWETTLEGGERPFSRTLAQRRDSAPAPERERLRVLEAELKPPAAFDGEISHQLVHRTVSTLCEARAFHARVAVMAVQSFGAATQNREQFDAFAAALGAVRINDEISSAPQHRAPRLLLAWCAGNPRFLKVDLGFAL